MSHFEQDFLISYGDEDLLSELKRLARALKRDALSMVGQRSECSHAAAIRERDAHNWGALSATRVTIV
jgi:hypothetical protein